MIELSLIICTLILACIKRTRSYYAEYLSSLKMVNDLCHYIFTIFSLSIHFTSYLAMFFLLKLTGVSNCREWRVSDKYLA